MSQFFKKILFFVLLFLVSSLFGFFGTKYLGNNSKEILNNAIIADNARIGASNANLPLTPSLIRRGKAVKGNHFSFSNQKKFYDEAFSANSSQNIQPREDIKSIVVNHHLLAKEMVGQIFEYIASDEAKTVILISPNHFMRGEGAVLTSKYNWITPYGSLEADFEIINSLLQKRALGVSERPFQEEHGITNMVSFIKKVLPNSKIVPLIVKDNITSEKLQLLSDRLADVLPENSVIIGSFDFSHTLPPYVSTFHDEKSIAVLKSLDYEGVNSLDIDSKPGLKLLISLNEKIGAKNFQIVNHANAGMILNNPNFPDTTSYITGYWTIGDENPETKITILAVGDLMLDRYIRKTIEKNGNEYPFSKITRFLMGSDFVLANLEGPVTNFKPKALAPNNLTFTFNPEIVPTLKKLYFNIFNLANNHTYNFGEKGLTQTREFLDQNGILYFGDPLNLENLSIIKEIRGKKIAFVGYNEYGTNNFDKIIEEVKRRDIDSDFVIVTPHWGIEYQRNFHKNQQKKAYELIDAGADLILGTHPHVIQPMEVYKNKMIFYSLGNFLFDQTFSIPTQRGLGVGIVIENDKMSFNLFPFEIKDLQIDLLKDDFKLKALEELAKGSKVTDAEKEEIKRGRVEVKF